LPPTSGGRQGHQRFLRTGRTTGVINTHLIPIADFILNRDFNFRPARSIMCWKPRCARFILFDFTKLAEMLLGDSIAR
jgi:indolepyruvate ferredoxin oxidoreductase